MEILARLARRGQPSSLKLPRKKTEVVGLVEARYDDAALLSAVQQLAANQDEDDYPAETYVFQQRKLLVGPIGLTTANFSRGAVDAKELAYTLAKILAPGHLLTLAKRLASDEALGVLSRAGKLTGNARARAYIQLVLAASPDDIARQINELVREEGYCLEVGNDLVHEEREYLAFIVTRWGIAVASEDDEVAERVLKAAYFHEVARAVAIVLDQLPNADALDAQLSDCEAPDRISRLQELVVELGPVETCQRCLSDVQVHEWLSRWGLTPPPLAEVSRDDLYTVFLPLVGLQVPRQPRGFHLLAKELGDLQLSVVGERQVPAWEYIAAFERAYEDLLTAYVVAFLFEEGDLTSLEVRASEGATQLALIDVVVKGDDGGPIPVRRMTFGQKVQTMSMVARRVRTDLEARERFEKTGRDVEQVKRLVGSEVQAVVQLRNDLAHNRPRSSGDIGDILQRALSTMLGNEPANRCLVPLRVIVEQESLDRYGWARLTLRDELGNEFLCCTTSQPYEIRTYSMFTRTTPIAVDPILV